MRHTGEVGIYHELSPEMQAYSRWQDGKFFEVKREFAKD